MQGEIPLKYRFFLQCSCQNNESSDLMHHREKRNSLYSYGLFDWFRRPEFELTCLIKCGKLIWIISPVRSGCSRFRTSLAAAAFRIPSILNG